MDMFVHHVMKNTKNKIKSIIFNINHFLKNNNHNTLLILTYKTSNYIHLQKY